MSQRCPVCKTPLWTDDVFSRHLKCPRCGAEFRPTVSWLQFRVVVLVMLVVGFMSIVFFSEAGPLLVGIIFVGLVLFFLLLPRFIQLSQIPPNLSMADGPLDDRQLYLEFRDWMDQYPDFQPTAGPGHLTLVAVLVCLLLLTVFVARLFF